MRIFLGSLWGKVTGLAATAWAAVKSAAVAAFAVAKVKAVAVWTWFTGLSAAQYVGMAAGAGLVAFIIYRRKVILQKLKTKKGRKELLDLGLEALELIMEALYAPIASVVKLVKLFKNFAAVTPVRA